MLQAVIKKGGVEVINVSPPALEDNKVLIQALYSCVSFGTENSTIKNSGKTLVQKAKEKPEKVKKVIDKILSDGPIEAFAMVKGELNVSTPTGYSLSGRVIGLGNKVNGLAIGDYVAAAGATANHAQIVSVPSMLVTKIEDQNIIKQASTVALGSIALHGVRRAGNKLGEQCVVIGTGILGLLTIQFLVKSGVRVCAIDLDEKKLKLANEYGAELAVRADDQNINLIQNWTGGIGADSVLVCASSPSNEIISSAFQMCRRKGKVVLVGNVGLDLKRSDFYNKEVDFQISTSYGPGRYDLNYEENGADYPISYVRWTEGRNMEEYIRLISSKAISIDEMITGVYDIHEAQQAFSRGSGDELNLLTLISYPEEKIETVAKIEINSAHKIDKDKITVGLIGAGSFTKSMILPNLSKLRKYFQLRSIYSRTGVKAKDLLESYEGAFLATSAEEIYTDPEIDLVIITTNHGSHAKYVLNALKNNKHVFVEKPLAVNLSELNEIRAHYSNKRASHPLLTVGFNRRFSPYAQEIQKNLSKRINPFVMYYRMNAGHLPSDHWVHGDGGRIIGECCHIIDLGAYFSGSRISSISYDYLTPKTEHIQSTDNRAITIKYQDGSIVHIQYFSVGHKDLSKEYFEIHFDQKSFIVDDYKRLNSFGSSAKELKSSKSDKGHLEIMREVGKSLTSEKPYWVIDLDSLLETTEATFKIAKD